jgi:hypothetical protein
MVDELPIVYHPLSDGPSVVRATLALQRRSAYDAAYLALAEDLDAELWTFDGPGRSGTTLSTGRGHRRITRDLEEPSLGS